MAIKKNRLRAVALFFSCIASMVTMLSHSDLVADARSSIAPKPKPTPQVAVLDLTVIPAERAARTLQSLFPHDRVRVDSHANAVIVAAAPDDIQQMRSVIQGIDVRDPQSASNEVIQLHVLKPASVITRLRSLYPAAHIAATSPESLLVRAVPHDMGEIKALISSLDVAPPSAPSSVPADAVRINSAKPRDVARALEFQIPHLRASVTGSSIILVGSQEDIQKAKTLVGVIDAPAIGSKYTQVYRLHNVDASSVADLVQRSYPNLRITVDKDLNALSVYATAEEQQRIANAISELDSAQTSTSGGPAGAPAYGASNIDVVELNSAMPGQNGSPSTSAQDIANAVQQLLQGISPDLRISVPANSSEILLAGSPTSLRLAHDVIAKLDRPQPLVVLDTEVLEVDESSAQNMGLSLGQAVISSNFSEVQPTPDPFTGQSGRMTKLQPLTRTGIQFSAVLNLLIQNGNARVLADPRVTTISGHSAHIQAGDQLAIITQTSGGVGTPVSQQLQTFNTGVTLDITPQVGPNGAITVALHPVVNSLEGILNGVPQIATRDTSTVVQLRDGETVVIGGLIQETMQRENTKIPLLGDIPLLGKLFQNSDSEARRNELIIVVTPHILKPGQAGPPVPNAVLPIPTPAPLPTLPPGTVLPNGSRQQLSHTEPTPITVDTPPAVQSSTRLQGPTQTPLSTPAAFAATNVFVFGSPPPNTYATDEKAPQIFYAQFSPTLVKTGTPVQVFAVTTSNVRRVTIALPSFMTSLSQISPSYWQGTFNFSTSGLFAGQNPTNVPLNAYRADGTRATIVIPVSIEAATP
jgi:type II secretory pathway component GspD/PulD (secretin)